MWKNVNLKFLFPFSLKHNYGIYIFPTLFLDQSFFTQNFSGPKFFQDPKYFGPTILLDPKFFQPQNSFWIQKFFSKIFSDTIFFWPKLFLTQQFLVTYKFWGTKSFLIQNIFLTQKLSWPQNCFGSMIFFYPKCS